LAEAPGAAPLLSLLEQIPEGPALQSEDFTYFADYSAIESAYDCKRPANAEAFDSPSSEANQVWLTVFMASPWVYDISWRTSLANGPEIVGFSPLQVDRALQFGTPPAQGLMLAGDFDADAVSTAYQDNIGLSASDLDGVNIWSWGDDPEDAFMTDLTSVVRENPFGGFIGRRQPMTIAGDLLMSSADIGVVQAHVKAAAGDLASFADVRGCRLAVDAVAEGGGLLQATIAGPALALPTTSLLVMADVVTDGEQIARVALVYADAASAEAAAASLLDDLAAYRLQSGETGAEMLARLNVTEPRHYVREGSDCAVLVLEFPTPKAPSAEIGKMRRMDYESGATRPGLVYRFFYTMFVQRDTGWFNGIVPIQ